MLTMSPTLFHYLNGTLNVDLDDQVLAVSRIFARSASGRPVEIAVDGRVFEKFTLVIGDVQTRRAI